MVWVNILKASLNTPSWEWIKGFEATEDSRFAWQLLVEKCKGQDATNKRALLATRVVSLSPNGKEKLYSNDRGRAKEPDGDWGNTPVRKKLSQNGRHASI